jgi:hypothetical protein
MATAIEFSEQDRVGLAGMVMEVFSEWRLTENEMVMLLGLPEGTRQRVLTRYRHGTPLPDDELVLERVRHILGISQSLQLLNPLNPGTGYLWLRNRSKYFHKRPPLQVMLEDGFPGLKQVWTNLDCTQGWD